MKDDPFVFPDHRRQQLLWRIRRNYATVTRQVTVGPLELAFTRIADPDRVLDDVAREEDLRMRLEGRRPTGSAPFEPLHLPYWAELWDSALGIGAWLTDHAERVRGRRVLDLGCGMGLAGTVAGALGAKVLFADLEPPALLFAALNSLPYAARVRTRRLDWRSDDLDERFDVILGADILYEREQWRYLEPFWRRHLAQDGLVLLGEPGRQTGQLFVPWIQSAGWKLTEESQPIPTRSQPIRLFVLRRP